jgi:hypothetical protein
MSKTIAVSFVLLLSFAAGPAASQDPDDSAQEQTPVYLRPPEERLAKITAAIKLGRSRQAKVRRVLEDVDAAVRRKVAEGRKKVRALLTAEEQEVFDELADDTTKLPQNFQQRRFMPGTSQGGQGQQRMGGGQQGAGSSGQQGMGGGQQGMSGGQQGMGGGQQGMGGGQQGMGGGQQRRGGPGGGRH